MPIQTICTICDTVLTIRVCKSAAGWYLGYICPTDGPYDRVTGYYDKERSAKLALTVVELGGCL